MSPTTFYVRRSKDSEVEGPFTIDQINQRLREKQLTLKSLALPDQGQGLDAVRLAPAKRWKKLPDIPGYEPDPDEVRNCLSIIFMILIVVVILVVIGVMKVMDLLSQIE